MTCPCSLADLGKPLNEAVLTSVERAIRSAETSPAPADPRANGRSSAFRSLVLLGLLSLSAWVCPVAAQAQFTATWAKNFGTAATSTVVNATAVDSSGNSYIAGYFNGGTLAVGGVTLTRIGTQDAFVAKLDSTGAVTWAKNFGGAGATAAFNAVAVDSSANVYLGGFFSGANLTTPAFTKIGVQDALTIQLTSAGAIAIDANLGTPRALNWGGAGATVGATSAVNDGAGNTYFGGYLSGANLTTIGIASSSTTLSAAVTKIGAQDALLLALPVSTGPVAKSFGGAGAGVQANGIAVDASGNVYLGGFFNTANLTSPSLTLIGTQDVFAFKLTSAGAVTWAKNFGGAGGTGVALGVAVDTSANVYLGGYFTSANLTTPAVTRIGATDALAIKLDSTGSVTWAKNLGGAGAGTTAQSIAVDASGNVYLGGFFNGANLTTPALSMIGTSDAFAVRLSSAGAVFASTNFGGAGAATYANGIAVDASANVYLGGYFQSANLTTPAVTKIGTADALIIKAASGASFTPQSGWYWNASQSGRGYAMELSGSNVFMAAYMYRSNGTDVWYVGSGTLSGSTITASLYEYQGGETLSGSFKTASVLSAVATATATFTSATQATLTFSGGTLGTATSSTQIVRYPFNGSSVLAASVSPAPQTGWYWNSTEGGTGYFIELQGSTIFMAAYMYETDGTARWYVASGTAVVSGSTLTFTATLQEYGSGQTLGGTYTAPTLSATKGQITVQFPSSTSATLTLPSGRSLVLSRFTF